MNIVDRMKSGGKVSIGMVHLLPLPGTFRNNENFNIILERAVKDAEVLNAAGFDAIIIENVNDGPLDGEGLTTQQTAAISIICAKIREAVDMEMGIDTCGDSIAGFGIGSLTGISFIRIPFFVDTRITAGGVTNPVAGKAVLTRKRLGVENIRIFADIQVKHSYALNERIPLEDSASWAVSSGADAIIVTGASTGIETPPEMLKRARIASGIPVVAGSGVNVSNAGIQYKHCDGAIIGSALKKNSDLMNPVDPYLAEVFMKAAKA